MVYVFLADGFEEIEALCPIDVMRRAGIDVKSVAVSNAEDKKVTGAHKIPVIADARFSDCDFSDAELLMLPGGMPGTLNLWASEKLKKLLLKANEDRILLAAICAAPMILGRLGLLTGKKATCFPGFEKELTGYVPTDLRVVKDGNIITGAGMGAALDFGLKITETLKGKADADKISGSICRT